MYSAGALDFGIWQILLQINHAPLIYDKDKFA
jgi:hypothetical protein